MKQEYQNGNMLLPLSNFHVPIPRKPTPYFHLTPKNITYSHPTLQVPTPCSPPPLPLLWGNHVATPKSWRRAHSHAHTLARKHKRANKPDIQPIWSLTSVEETSKKLNRHRAVKVFLIFIRSRNRNILNGPTIIFKAYDKKGKQYHKQTIKQNNYDKCSIYS